MGIADLIDAAQGRDEETVNAVEAQLLAGLNPEQREAVLHEDGPAGFIAVAGSGKTRVLVHRLARLVKVCGVNPSRILAVTFSKKGADEMNERLKAIIGESGARVGTFHSVALEIHKLERLDCISDEGWDWKVDSKDRYRVVIKEVIGWKEMKWKKADVTLVTDYISECKGAMARPMTEEAQGIADSYYRKDPSPKTNPRKLMECYDRCEQLRRERRLLQFDDMLFDVAEGLQSNEDMRIRHASRWDYVMQDEAQDQSLPQLLMGELFSRDHRNYCLVGDPAQTIYTWRGARPEKLLSFEERWGAKVITMGRNYRCGQVIVDAANCTLDSMDPATRLDVSMICEKGTEGTITSTENMTIDAEGESVASRIQQIITDNDYEPRHCVILYRTNAQSRAPEEALIGERIPYRIIGSTSFYERREIKNLLAYLRLADGYGKFSDWMDSMERCINTPFRFLGRAYVGRVSQVARDHARTAKKTGEPFSWLSVIHEVNEQQGVNYKQRASAEDWANMIEELRTTIKAAKAEDASEADKAAAFPTYILDRIVTETDYAGFLRRDEGEESTENSRVSNVREMVRAAGRFPSVRELLDYVAKTIKAGKRSRREKDPNKVTLCSIHRSKGLEWPIVFVIGCAEGILPHGRAEDPEEETRLFYVATTRAKDELHYSYAMNIALGNRVLSVAPSAFLATVGHPPMRGSVELDGGSLLS
jgi:DNA helicase-2/ATP-dependent DNA helicase PcrA